MPDSDPALPQGGTRNWVYRVYVSREKEMSETDSEGVGLNHNCTTDMTLTEFQKLLEPQSLLLRMNGMIHTSGDLGRDYWR